MNKEEAKEVYLAYEEILEWDYRLNTLKDESKKPFLHYRFGAFDNELREFKLKPDVILKPEIEHAEEMLKKANERLAKIKH